MKIKLSKSQWEAAGKKAGWMKLAQTNMSVFHEVAEEVGGTVRSYLKDGFPGTRECVAIDCHDPVQCIEKAASKGIFGARFAQLGRGSIVFWPAIAYQAMDISQHSGYLNALKSAKNGVYIVDETGILESYPIADVGMEPAAYEADVSGKEALARRSWKQFDMDEKDGIGIAIVEKGNVEWLQEPNRYNRAPK